LSAILGEGFAIALMAQIGASEDKLSGRNKGKLAHSRAITVAEEQL
jgi:hypothetical protein